MTSRIATSKWLKCLLCDKWIPDPKAHKHGEGNQTDDHKRAMSKYDARKIDMRRKNECDDDESGLVRKVVERRPTSRNRYFATKAPSKPTQYPPSSEVPAPRIHHPIFIGQTYVALRNYDGVETNGGVTEDGYLDLEKGDMLTLISAEFENGTQENQYAEYGYFTNSREREGWAPTACVKAKHRY